MLFNCKTGRFSIATTKILGTVAGAAILATSSLMLTTAVQAEEIQSSIVRGAHLYDKWYKVTDDDAPMASHPLYPVNKKYAKKPGANWRCKECHGWDGMGKDGGYASGKHSTGIKGINGMIGADPAKVVAVLKSKQHGYGDKLEAEDLQDLAMFVTKGQVDMRKLIDYSTKKPINADLGRGEVYFNTICAGCHRKDGTYPKDMHETLGKVAGNPQEAMHKILNGQPGAPMPALRALDRQVVVDILAYVQTLPKKK